MSALAVIVARNRAGAAVGLPSFCTAHPETLSAILRCYRDDAAPVLIEATCNQVNQSGGYTGMTPADFHRFAERLAIAEGVAPNRLILGGDHLGPNPWRRERAAAAMDKARAMIAAYVSAGFAKIHLDASMACADDAALSAPEMARRAADLAAAAETAAAREARRPPPAYVIGTEVPAPGGEPDGGDALAVTTPDAARRTLELHREAFAARGLEAAFARVVALVVQPGVDFSNDRVMAFDPPAAAPLGVAAPDLGGPVFEAHSTDYQSGPALRALVGAHFAILKVGPELTFAFRQAAFALARLAGMLGQPNDLVAVLLAAMRADPADWRDYVAPGQTEETMMLYGLSDRARYYWARPTVRTVLERLFSSLRTAQPVPGQVAQVMGGFVEPVQPAQLPEAAVSRMVGAVVGKYRDATGG